MRRRGKILFRITVPFLCNNAAFVSSGIPLHGPFTTIGGPLKNVTGPRNRAGGPLSKRGLPLSKAKEPPCNVAGPFSIARGTFSTGDVWNSIVDGRFMNIAGSFLFISDACWSSGNVCDFLCSCKP